MKIFDIVDKDDSIIGTATAEKCHSDPKLIHRAIHFTLVDRPAQKILITQRSYQVKFDSGKLCFPGEHVLSGETYQNTVKKGVKNELGFVPKKFKEFGRTIFRYDKQREMARFFVAYWKGEEINYDEKEIIAIRWLDLNSLIAGKNNYSAITKFWVEHIDWEKVFNSKDNCQLPVKKLR